MLVRTENAIVRLARLAFASLADADRAAGFNVETVEYKNISFTVWDVGGQDKVQIFS